MSETNSSELRLKIMDAIASTILKFTEQDGLPMDEKQDNLRAVEDISEYIVNSLGLKVMDGTDHEGRIVATMTQETPEEYNMRSIS
jgi:hypothetical protein